MKIIALGDIHGNLPALEVALRESRAEGYDLVCHTGDLVGLAPFPDETVDLLRATMLPGVRGHVDESLATDAETSTHPRDDPETARFMDDAYAWTARHIGRRTRRYLGDLPFEQRIDADGRRAVVLHATPIDPFTPMWEERDDDFFREMGDAADADIVILGHTHRPYHRIVDGRHFINAGSVGFPRDGDPRTGYLVILTNGHVEVQYRRFPYDTERLLKVAAARGFPAASRFFGPTTAAMPLRRTVGV